MALNEQEKNLLLVTHLRPEQVQVPKLLNEWAHGNNQLFLAELDHNDAACDPFSSCNGKVTVGFSDEQKGKKETPCRGCKQKVTVNLSVLRIELGLV